MGKPKPFFAIVAPFPAMHTPSPERRTETFETAEQAWGWLVSQRQSSDLAWLPDGSIDPTTADLESKGDRTGTVYGPRVGYWHDDPIIRTGREDELVYQVEELTLDDLVIDALEARGVTFDDMPHNLVFITVCASVQVATCANGWDYGSVSVLGPDGDWEPVSHDPSQDWEPVCAEDETDPDVIADGWVSFIRRRAELAGEPPALRDVPTS